MKNLLSIGGALLLLAAALLTGCASQSKAAKLPPPQPLAESTNTAGPLMRHLLRGPFPELPALQMELPATYVAEREDGRDFTVFYLRDRRLKAGVGIYLGPAPQFHHQRDPYLSVSAEKGKLGSREVEWRRYQNKGLFCAETVIPEVFKSLSRKEGDRLALCKMHVFLTAPNPALLAELEAAVGRMQVREPAAP
ncbi:MAG: hypothetical protein N3J91_08315 [Verrucomicrobiae bacterium]|nr:hypothetical protein [Verrucomicrobiae bacterium]